jgi:uncharacterized protein
MHLSQINIYPVKSLDGYTTQSATIEKKGLQYDRRWMIVDQQGTFQTQRNNPSMALLRATIENGYLQITQKKDPRHTISIPLDLARPDQITVSIWDDTCTAKLVSKPADKWLSKALGKECHLVLMPETTQRPVDQKYNTDTNNPDTVSFADGYPFLIIGEESLNLLNSKLEQPITMQRFRPNLIFSGGSPHQEDNFIHFQIGDAQFQGVKPCARCVLITINPETGVKEKEPLPTLNQYRKFGQKILFGQNLIWKGGTNNIQVGNPIKL